MPQQHLAVIGAGPKAAAIAAKAFCLRQLGAEISVTIFERYEAGAFWTGRHGYTDGLQHLCTPAERDFGYPYLAAFGADVTRVMQETFSWQAFLVDRQSRNSSGYSDWVNRGRKPPTHQEFAEYISYAITRAEAQIEIGRVTRARRVRGRWRVDQQQTDQKYEFNSFHGLVVTGPGPQTSRVESVSDPRILNGVNFWRRLPSIRRRLRRLRNPVVVIGGGGTAAAISGWFVRENHPGSVVLLNSQAMLHTRTSNFFENALFDSPETWQALPIDQRETFTKRLNRGAVWESVTDLLSNASNLTLVPGRAVRIGVNETASDAENLEVTYENALGTATIVAGLVIDATGFDPWAFGNLLAPELRETISTTSNTLGRSMRDDLSLPLIGPRLHVPGASEIIGPGYGSLMALGAMADRILDPYYRRAIA